MKAETLYIAEFVSLILFTHRWFMVVFEELRIAMRAAEQKEDEEYRKKLDEIARNWEELRRMREAR
jgi:hypothetical protein